MPLRPNVPGGAATPPYQKGGGDWEQPANNDFLLVSQFSVTGALYTCRPDLVGFVNGLPLVVIELKKPGVPARAAFDENLTHYKAEIPQFFWFNALLVALRSLAELALSAQAGIGPCDLKYRVQFV